MTKFEKRKLYSSFAFYFYELTIVVIILSALNLQEAESSKARLTWDMNNLALFVKQGVVSFFKDSTQETISSRSNLLLRIYGFIVLLIFNQIYSRRERSFICGLVYQPIEESKSMALYQTITVKRQELFNTNKIILMDRLNAENLGTSEELSLVRFEWWSKVEATWANIKRIAVDFFIGIIYYTCSLCGDYGLRNRTCKKLYFDMNKFHFRCILWIGTLF